MITVRGYSFVISLFLYCLYCESVEQSTTCSTLYQPHPEDCSKYYMCNHGELILMSCFNGLEWNSKDLGCDWPENAKCQRGSNKKNGPSKPDSPNALNAPNTPNPQDTANTPKEANTLNNNSPTTGISNEIHSPPASDDGKYKVVCYFSNWAWYRQDKGKFMPEDIDANLCTHIIYAFAVLDDASLTIKTHDPWADIDNKFYERVTAYRKKGVKVLIAIGGWGDSQGSKYGRLLPDSNARSKFIKSAIEFIKKHNFDGLDLDLEYPACWQGNCEPSRAQEKEGFADLVKELSEAFKPNGLLLSAAVSANNKVVDAAYDIPKLGKHLDWINLMTYDFHGHFDGKTGHNAPIRSDDKSDIFNVESAVDHWIQGGAPPKKLVMGMPTYGQSFTLANAQNNGYNAPSSGPGQAGQYTNAPGTLSYYEICDKTKNNGWNVVRDKNQIGPYAYRDNQWVSFDDVDSFNAKSKVIKDKNLGGGMIWTLDFDDFSGTCGCSKYPLLTTMNQALRDVGGPKTRNCT